VRTPVSPAHARPSGPKLSVLLRRSYVLSFNPMCWSSPDQAVTRARDHEPELLLHSTRHPPLHSRPLLHLCDPRPSAAVWSRTPLCQASLDTTNAAGLPACSLNGRLNRRLSPDTNS
jgi:hypothetical protein